MFKIGVVTDEISDDLQEAIEIAKSWGIEHIELHSIWGRNICDLDDASLSRVISIVRKSGMKVTVIDSLTLRCHLDNDEEYSQHIAHLIRSIRIAPLFDTEVVRLFSFWKEPDMTEEKWERIFERMELPIKIAEREGVTLGFENVSSGNIGTSEDLVKLFERFDSPNLKLIWDPGNAHAAGEARPYPDGYERIKQKVIHVHMKDSAFRGGRHLWLPIGEGDVDYEGQLRALKRDGYTGVIALETHYKPPGGSKVEGTRRSFEGLMRIIGKIEREG
jgi:sugar phosphate isomerase/epimerase